jgi:tripartite ATP-independent transporter DctM subunit
MTLITLFILMLIFVLAGIPIAFAIGMSSMLVMIIFGNMPLVMVAQKVIFSADSFLFLAVPFFIFAGVIMERGGISDRLVRFAKALVGQIRGGLAMASVLSSIIFAGLSGSAVADASAIGSILIPAMKKSGYKKEFVVGLQSSAAILGPIIPPSVLMIIYGSMTDLSIARLFLAGIIPGLLIGGALILASYVFAVRHGYPAEARAGLRELWESLKNSILALILPAIIIFGILFGIFTPTEAGAVAVAYSLVLTLFVYKTIRLRDLKDLLVNATLKTAVCMIVVAMASAFAWIIARERGPQLLIEALLSVSNNPYVIMVLLVFLLILIGTVVDTMAATIILTPVLAPLAAQYGFDPIHFGLIVLMSLIVGLITPPVGVVLYVTCEIGEVKVHEVTKYIFIFVAIMVATILIMVFIPKLILFIPSFY